MPKTASQTDPKKTRPKSGYSLAEYEAVKRELDKLVAAGVICDGKRHDAWQAEMAEIERKWKSRIDRLTVNHPHGWPPDSHESRLFHMYARRKVKAQKKCTAKHFPPRTPAPAKAPEVAAPLSDKRKLFLKNHAILHRLFLDEDSRVRTVCESFDRMNYFIEAMHKATDKARLEATDEAMKAKLEAEKAFEESQEAGDRAWKEWYADFPALMKDVEGLFAYGCWPSILHRMKGILEGIEIIFSARNERSQTTPPPPAPPSEETRLRFYNNTIIALWTLLEKKTDIIFSTKDLKVALAKADTKDGQGILRPLMNCLENVNLKAPALPDQDATGNGKTGAKKQGEKSGAAVQAAWLWPKIPDSLKNLAEFLMTRKDCTAETNEFTGAPFVDNPAKVYSRFESHKVWGSWLKKYIERPLAGVYRLKLPREKRGKK
jgi:hypothetical protein